MWLAPTQTITAAISGSMAISGSALISGSVQVLDVARTQVVLVVTTTTFAAATTTALFTIYQGVTQTTAAVTAWVVPAGKTFRVLAVQAVVGTSAVATFNTISVLNSTANPTNVAAAPIAANAFINCNAAVVSGGVIGLAQDIAAGVTVAIGIRATTSSFLSAASIVGYLFP
jgi:hypothetical protein